jgi:hypothetical protein
MTLGWALIRSTRSRSRLSSFNYSNGLVMQDCLSTAEDVAVPLPADFSPGPLALTACGAFAPIPEQASTCRVDCGVSAPVWVAGAWGACEYHIRPAC